MKALSSPEPVIEPRLRDRAARRAHAGAGDPIVS
jgi:hypothetical protein